MKHLHTTKEHEHDWEVVQRQTLYEGFKVTGINPTDDGEIEFIIEDTEAWQDVDGSANVRVHCGTCDIEFPYYDFSGDGSWSVEYEFRRK